MNVGHGYVQFLKKKLSITYNFIPIFECVGQECQDQEK